MELRGTQHELMMLMARPGSDVSHVLKRLGRIPSQLLAPQQALLFLLATKQKHVGPHFLEIGTGAGHSAALMASAGGGEVQVITMDSRPNAVRRARGHLAGIHNVILIQEHSWNYLKDYSGPQLAMIFVDGDHKHVAMDMPWWEHLMPGGLILFHDYTPPGAARQCPNVWAEVNLMAQTLGREPDVMMILEDQTGMAGFYKR